MYVIKTPSGCYPWKWMKILNNSSSCLLIVAKISDWKERLDFVNGLGYSQEWHYNNSSFLWKHVNYHWINLKIPHDLDQHSYHGSEPVTRLDSGAKHPIRPTRRLLRSWKFPSAGIPEIIWSAVTCGGGIRRSIGLVAMPCDDSVVVRLLVCTWILWTYLRQQLWNRTDGCSFSVK